MKKVFLSFIVFTTLLLPFLLSCQSKNETSDLPLAGYWNVVLDTIETWKKPPLLQESRSQTIFLPGTTDDAQLGKANKIELGLTKKQLTHLIRRNSFVGRAWYTKEINIPKQMLDKQLVLFMERVIWRSEVWVNGTKAKGSLESLSTPHRYDITNLIKEGTNTISILIDNRKQHETSVNEGLAHSYTDHTQIKWNGIIGDFCIKALDSVHINHINVLPCFAKKSILISIDFANRTDKDINGILNVVATHKNFPTIKTQKNICVKRGSHIIEAEIPLDETFVLWDEFSPNLYELQCCFKTPKYTTIANTTFGIRQLSNQNGQLQINGHRMFLRGTLECCIFPLTGYPPMQKQEWAKLFATARNWGLNHLRFHSWCPPEAAFAAADEAGFYLQIELPYWELNFGKDSATVQFLYNEAQRIITEYGNHPSFCLWSMGNEIQGNFDQLNRLLFSIKEQDNRHLYCSTSFTFEKNHGTQPEPYDDFFVTQWTKNGWVRGQGVFNTNSPRFDQNYQSAINDFKVPVITHEIGQYSVYPNLKEIDKYTGVLEPINFKSIKQDLEQKGLLDKADDYLQASGKLAAILYKEEIERALKTPGISGFQLLDLHDFPGQGTALVGLLDAFWDSKGITTAKEFTQACSPIVPLLSFPKATYKSSEKFSAKIDIANYGSSEIIKEKITWTIKTIDGKIIGSSTFKTNNLHLGYNEDLEIIECNLNTVTNAQELIITVNLTQTEHQNSWKIWVYPEIDLPQTNIIYTTHLDTAIYALNQGEKVLFNPNYEMLEGIEGKFVPVFWSPVHFPKQAGTMGLLCNPKHLAFALFPTDMHTDWQWWDLLKHSRTIVIDSIPEATPLVEMIDNFMYNRRLANTFEAQVGKGKLLFTSIDLHSDIEERLEAKQLRISLLNYMQSSSFNPNGVISEQDIKALFLPQKIQTNERPDAIY